jgi:hypothetical protein
MDDINSHATADAVAQSHGNLQDVSRETSFMASLKNNAGEPILQPVHTEDSYFEDGPAPARPHSLTLRELGAVLNSSKRRAATLHVAIRGAGTAWIDQDDSGTYDPDKERVTPLARPQQRKTRAKKYDSDGNTITPPRARKGPPRGYRSMLTFSLTSVEALDYLRSISPGPYESRSTSPTTGISEISDIIERYEETGPVLKRRRKTRKPKKVRELLERQATLNNFSH